MGTRTLPVRPVRRSSAPPAPAARGFFVSGFPRRREHPLPHLGHAIVVAGVSVWNSPSHAQRQGDRSVNDAGTARNVLFRFVSRDPSFENARVVVKLVSHVAELQCDLVVLRAQRFCQYAAKLSLLAEIGSCGTHAV